jgi:serine/threonine protein phosphatase PrpC
MDEIDIRSAPDSGTQIVCRRWVRTARDDLTGSLWEVGVFTRPCQGRRQNGDAFVVKEWQGQLLVGLIDGLGHGELAQRAAVAAQQYIEAHHDQPLEKIFSGVARASRATRGVVMALAGFRSSTRLHFGSIGNVEVRAWSGPERFPFILQRGILGAQESPVRIQEFKWRPDWLLVLHTDGLRAHWQWSDFPGLQREPAEFAARKLMGALATEQDDATVLVVRHRTS